LSGTRAYKGKRRNGREASLYMLSAVWAETKANSVQGNMQRRIQGPFEDDVLVHKDGEVSDKEMSVCSKASARFQLTLSASLSATSSTLSGVVQGGSLDTTFQEMLGLGWKKC
jgi:hypothetical protein